MKKRTLVFLLAMVMVITTLSVSILAVIGDMKTDSGVNQNASDSSDLYISYVSNVTFDGLNTNNEYAHAHVTPVDSYGEGETDTTGDQFRVIYSDDAIYLFIESKDDTDNGTSDFIDLYFRIGESYIGRKQIYKTINEGAMENFGGHITIANRWAHNSDYFLTTKNNSGYAMECRFPVENMTDADKKAFEDRTLDLGFAVQIRNTTDAYRASCEGVKDFYKGEEFVSKYPTYYMAEKDEVEDPTFDPTKRYMSYVPSVTLDGKNTGNEYGDAYTVQLNVGGKGNPADDGDRYRVVYTDDAIYVLVEAYDTTFNHKYSYNYTGTPIVGEGNNGDNIEFYFKIGDTFIGSKQRFRDSDPNPNNFGGTKTWNKGNGKLIDYHATRNGVTTTNGYSYEMKFPISELTAAEQEAFKNGTLDVRFGALMRDGANTYHMDNWEANKFYNGAAYVKYYHTFTFKDKDLCTDYTKKVAVYKDSAVLDGKNTAGEYDDSNVVLLNGMSRYAPDDEDGYRVIYTPEGIYVYIENYDTTFDNRYDRNGIKGLGTSADYIDFYFKVGETFIGRKQRYRDSDPDASNYGGLKTWNKTYGAQTESNTTVDGKVETTGFAYEAFFPVSELSDKDKIAYLNGTLDVKFAVMLQDYSGDYVSDSASGLSLWNGASYVKYYTQFTLGDSDNSFDLPILGRDMMYVESARFDGKNSSGEYDGAYVNYIAIGGKGNDGAGDIYRVIYTDDAIYVLIEIVDDTVEYYYERTVDGIHYPAMGGNADNIQFFFRIGESFIGCKQHYRDSWNPISDYGSAIDMREGYGQWDDETGWLICINNKEKGMTMEMKFPVDGMTEEDQEAFRTRTLDVGFSVFVRDGKDTWHGDDKETSKFWNGASYVKYYPTFKFRPYVADRYPIPITEKIDIIKTIQLVEPEYEGAKLRFTIGSEAPVDVEGILINETTKEYKFSYKVHTKFMGEVIKIELVNKEGVVIEEVDSYIMRNYCLSLLGKTNDDLRISVSEYNAMKDLICAVLDLGAASQKYNDYKTDDLVNDETAGMTPDYSIDYSANKIVDRAKETYGIEILEMGVTTNEAASILNRLYVIFTADDINNVKVGLADDRAMYLGQLEITDLGNGTYMAISSEISIDNFDKDYIINISYVEADGPNAQIYKIACSVNAGLADLIAIGDEFALASYNYGVAIRYYLAA